MCKQQILVKNPSRMYVDGLSDMFLRVPCGHCKECLKSMQDDWFVRALFEFKRVKALGGSCWFPTLSYNNANLPYYEDEENNFSCVCFNRKHLKNFRDKLRVYLRRKGYVPDGIRYIIVPEFGGKKGRPHYHALLFVPFYVDVKDMVSCLKRAWIHGFVMRSKKGWMIESIQGVQYAMKYTSKLQYWSLKYNIPEYEQFLKDNIKQARQLKDIDSELHYSDILREFRLVSPRHCQSTFFGVDGLDYFKTNGHYDIDKLVDMSINANKCGINTLIKFNYKMPRYYFQKIFTNIDSEGVSHKNELYKKVLKKQFDNNVKNKVASLSIYFQTPELLAEHLRPLDISRFQADKIFKDLHNYLGQSTLEQLVLFDVAYRNLPVDSSTFNFEGMKQREIKSFLLDNAFDFVVNKKFVDIPPTPLNESLSFTSPELFDFNRPTFNKLPCFKRFVKILLTVEEYERNISRLVESAFRTNEVKASKIDKSSAYEKA